VFTWLRSLAAALDRAFVFFSFVDSSANETLRFLYAFAEVVAAATAHTHAALAACTSKPMPLASSKPLVGSRTAWLPEAQ
jgi:hypothetical protein